MTTIERYGNAVYAADKRYSAGAMRAAVNVTPPALTDISQKATALWQETAAAIISKETGDLALIEALERTLSWLTSYPGGGPMGADGPYEQARAALAAARKES